MIQKTYFMVKPEFANNEKLVEAVQKRVADAGLEIEFSSYVKYDEETASEHYAEHKGKGFYPELLNYITSDKAFGMIVSGEDAIATIRALAGPTKNAPAGTIRGDFGIGDVTKNVVHSSDSPESAEREIAIFKKAVEKSK